MKHSIFFLFGIFFFIACSDRSVSNSDASNPDSNVIDLKITQDDIAKMDLKPKPDMVYPNNCKDNLDCNSFDYCHIENGCVVGNIMGECKLRPDPDDCPLTTQPSCGCDGKEYGSDCNAHAVGMNVAHVGHCVSCSTDQDCTNSAQWCEQGICIDCDNSGMSCDLGCFDGWDLYQRNGCLPCACAPINECIKDSDCGPDMKCYAGEFCWDWCEADDPSCCYGNTCSAKGCDLDLPTGCWTIGCPKGQDCIDDDVCKSSACECTNGEWQCTSDCNGGNCKPAI